MLGTLITLGLMGASGWVGYKLGEGGTKFKMNPTAGGVTITVAQRDALLNAARVDPVGRGSTRPSKLISRATHTRLAALGLMDPYAVEVTPAGRELVRSIVREDGDELRSAGWNV